MTDPDALALALLDRLLDAPHSAASALTEALDASADHPKVVDVALTWAEDLPHDAMTPALRRVLSALGERLDAGPLAARLLLAASAVAGTAEDPQIAVELAFAALIRDPSSTEARAAIDELVLGAEIDERPVVADALERLAELTLTGRFPAGSFDALVSAWREVLGDELELAIAIRQRGG